VILVLRVRPTLYSPTVSYVRYLITVRDEVSERLAATVAPLATDRVERETHLTVDVADQAELLRLVIV